MNKNNTTINVHLPVLIQIVLISTGFALFGGIQLLGFNITGLAWVVPLSLSMLFIIQRVGKIKFPIWIWIPWIILLILYSVNSQYSSLQRTVQLICPIVIGCAISTLNINNSQLKYFFNICKKFAVVIILISLIKTGVLSTGIIPNVTGLAAEIMTALLLCTLFASAYAIGDKKMLIWWGLMTALPVFAVTRTAIALAGFTLPSTFAPLSIKKRIVFVIAGLIIGLFIFNLSRIQNKMFYSGQGTIQDLMGDDLATSGRKYMAENLINKISHKPWLGYGTGSGERYTYYITRGATSYPHNDWLLTLHDQGILGATIYALTILGALLHALYRTFKISGERQILFFSGASSFVILALMMFTDNIMVYASFFGNLQFTILGLAYASMGTELKDKQTYQKKSKIVISW